MPEWLESGRTVGVPAVASVVDARKMRFRREGVLGRFGVGMKSVMSLPTGTGKTATAVAVAIEMARQGQRLTLVVKDRAEHEAVEARLKAAWAGLDEAAGDQAAPDSFRLVPEPYAPRRLRARPTPEAAYRALCMRAAEWEESGAGSGAAGRGGRPTCPESRSTSGGGHPKWGKVREPRVLAAGPPVPDAGRGAAAGGRPHR